MAELQVRAALSDDLDLFNRWAEARQVQNRLHKLTGFGCVVEADGVPIFAAQLEASADGVGHIHSCISDPGSDRWVRRQAWEMGVEYLEGLARGMGYLGLVTACNVPGLSERYEALGYQVKERGLTLLTKEF